MSEVYFYTYVDGAIDCSQCDNNHDWPADETPEVHAHRAHGVDRIEVVRIDEYLDLE